MTPAVVRGDLADAADPVSAERKRAMRRQILQELENPAVPAPTTIDQEVQET
jgi:hypothetical protein